MGNSRKQDDRQVPLQESYQPGEGKTYHPYTRQPAGPRPEFVPPRGSGGVNRPAAPRGAGDNSTSGDQSPKK